MIYGHGIDLQDISAIQRAYDKRQSFAHKILTEKELELFQTLKAPRTYEFLAGRWAAKEAFSKALGTGLVDLSFQDIEIMKDSKGAPIVTVSPFEGKVHLSISHSGSFVQASVILESIEENERN
ncbi:holo-ACP synthase [Streptococcus sp. S784/96/1]|uniref:holo-ACP synthase n=1 Tax=Streptococcus sp. S784/96/1 TaxID=2653499 RepID=UPI001386C840|nr:holo-ACP synthase [Streptococcus sp. S784/96/1]